MSLLWVGCIIKDLIANLIRARIRKIIKFLHIEILTHVYRNNSLIKNISFLDKELSESVNKISALLLGIKIIINYALFCYKYIALHCNRRKLCIHGHKGSGT